MPKCYLRSVDQQYMKRCFYLASLGLGRVAPNPLVGSVIVENSEIIGEGYHRILGGPHAEVHAVNAVKDSSRLRKATLYVNLEPCAHYGKTPPCAPMIAQHKIPRVVISTPDPFDAVNGKGIEILKKAGVEVITNVCVAEGEWLNRRFLTFHQKRRPYVILKFAQSADGFIDSDRMPDETGVNWISEPDTQFVTHRWRTEEPAILIGTRTALIDNPSLTARRISGKQPVRLLIDRVLKVKPTARIFSKNAKTVVFNEKKQGTENHVQFVKLHFDEPLPQQILNWAYEAQLQSIIVEGGSITHQSFLDAGLWDEAREITGPVFLKNGLKAPEFSGNLVQTMRSGKDLIRLFTKPQ